MSYIDITSSFNLQTNQLFEEKDDHIERLQERVETLEQQRRNEALSVQALEKEVSGDSYTARLE